MPSPKYKVETPQMNGGMVEWWSTDANLKLNTTTHLKVVKGFKMLSLAIQWKCKFQSKPPFMAASVVLYSPVSASMLSSIGLTAVLIPPLPEDNKACSNVSNHCRFTSQWLSINMRKLPRAIKAPMLRDLIRPQRCRLRCIRTRVRLLKGGHENSLSDLNVEPASDNGSQWINHGITRCPVARTFPLFMTDWNLTGL